MALPRPNLLSPTQAAASQLRAISRPLIELQQANMDRRAACPGAHATPTLLQLREQCSAPMRRLAALHEAVRLALRAQSAAERCASKSGSGGGGEHRMGGQPGRPGPEHPKRGGHVAATASSMLLDALHLMLESDTLTTGPEGQVLQQQLLHLFLCALTPLLDGLHTWLYDNWEDHFPGEVGGRAVRNAAGGAARPGLPHQPEEEHKSGVHAGQMTDPGACQLCGMHYLVAANLVRAECARGHPWAPSLRCVLQSSLQGRCSGGLVPLCASYAA